MEKIERHFLLVHGACHGAWYWYRISTLLKSKGHKVTVLDMTASGIHPKQVHEVDSFLDFTELLFKFMVLLQPGERVILVGHSMGGMWISAAMESFPERISVAVYAAAFMPGPDLNYSTISEELNGRLESYMDTHFTFDEGHTTLQQPSSLGPISWHPNSISSHHRRQDLELALSLVRPFRLLDHVKASTSTEPQLTKEKYGSVPRVYIVCDQDYALKEDFQRWMIDHNPPDQVKVISGSDHMLMFSKPLELCSSPSRKLQTNTPNYVHRFEVIGKMSAK